VVTYLRRGVLTRSLVLAALVASIPALADGTLAVRGAYYKERSTRVIQPMLDGMFDAGLHGIVTGHFLVDAITSASPGAGAVGVPFTEQRYEAGLGYLHDSGPYRLGADTKYSTESDYRSIYVGARGEMDLAQKNATLGVGGGISFDDVANTGAQGPMGGPMLVCDNTRPMDLANSCSLRTASLFASASQLLGKNAVVGVTYDLAATHGFQANPYRSVIADGEMTAERHPNDRLRQAFAISARYYLAPTETTFIAAYRYYRDDWHIHAHTPELRIVQQFGRNIDASIRYRYYTQTAAYFFQKRYDTSDPAIHPYVTDDPKMSAFDGHTLEAKLGILGEAFRLGGRWAGTRFEGILEYVVQHDRFGNAIIAHAALTVPFNY
jgi:hypothetical protein